MSRFSEEEKDISFTFEGKPFIAKEGDTVAAALCANDLFTNRKTINKATPRGSFCHMRVCYECLVTVNGQQSVQGCMCHVTEGMEIKQNG